MRPASIRVTIIMLGGLLLILAGEMYYVFILGRSPGHLLNRSRVNFMDRRLHSPLSRGQKGWQKPWQSGRDGTPAGRQRGSDRQMTRQRF